MTFTKQPPTTTGFYAWATSEHHRATAIPILFCVSGDGIRSDCDGLRPIDYGGEWCRLVPAEEVEKAWKEFVKITPYMAPKLEAYRWNKSRAKQIAEGTI